MILIFMLTEHRDHFLEPVRQSLRRGLLALGPQYQLYDPLTAQLLPHGRIEGQHRLKAGSRTEWDSRNSKAVTEGYRNLGQQDGDKTP